MQRLVSTATLPMAVGKAFFEHEGIYEALNNSMWMESSWYSCLSGSALGSRHTDFG